MDEKIFRSVITVIIKIGELILPKGSDDPDPQKAMLASLGCIVDTQEWLKAKIAYLDPADDEGLRDWVQYIIEKAENSGLNLNLRGLKNILAA